VPAAAIRDSDVFASNRAQGRLALAVAASGGITRRQRVHEAGPVRVRCPGPPAGALEAVLVNTAGGMAGGDHFDLDVKVGDGAHLVLTTAAAEKVYRTLGPDTTVDVAINVAEGGALAWLPQETILFDQARLSRRIEVDLADGARLLLAEAVVFGRSGMGEAVIEGHLSDRWRVRRGGRLIHAESVRLNGAISEKLAEPAIGGGSVAMATVLMVPGDGTAVDAVRKFGDSFRGEVGASAWNGLAVMRFCAKDGAALRNDLALVLVALHGGALPRLWTK
jgi:urease accessory protein